MLSRLGAAHEAYKSLMASNQAAFAQLHVNSFYPCTWHHPLKTLKIQLDNRDAIAPSWQTQGPQSSSLEQEASSGQGGSTGHQSQKIKPCKHPGSWAERPRDWQWHEGVLTVPQERDELHGRNRGCTGGKKRLQQVAPERQRNHGAVGRPGEGK